MVTIKELINPRRRCTFGYMDYNKIYRINKWTPRTQYYNEDIAANVDLTGKLVIRLNSRIFVLLDTGSWNNNHSCYGIRISVHGILEMKNEENYQVEELLSGDTLTIQR